MLLCYAECGRLNESFDVFRYILQTCFIGSFPRKTSMRVDPQTYRISNRADEFNKHTYYKNYLLLLLLIISNDSARSL